MITTVLLDIDNTLLDFRRCAEEAMRETFYQWELPYKAPMFDTFTAINDGLWRELECGKLTRDELLNIRWQRVFDRLGVVADGVAFQRDFGQRLSVSHHPVEGAVELLTYLAPRYTVAVASNAPQRQQERRLESAGMRRFIDNVFTSEGLGAAKPSRAFFDGCFARLPGVRREETMLIGDSLTADIAGGRDAGLTTCWFNPRGESAPPEIVPDHTVHTLHGIRDIL